MRTIQIACAALLAGITLATSAQAQSMTLSAAEARAIARDAVIWGFPLVDSYRIQYSYFVDRGGPEYKAPWNTLVNSARVYTPDDKAVQTPNSDTPYSFIGADLRTEPLVITVPAVEKGRYYSGQFIDMYTYNFAYVGSRAAGNGAGNFILAGPFWSGQKPPGVRSVIRSETNFAAVVFRTQLFNPGDIDNVKRIQAGYRVQTLSQFLGKPAPEPAPTINFMKPSSADQERTSLDFFNELNFILQFCPTNPAEAALRARFAKIGVDAGKRIDLASMTPGMQKAYLDGMADAWKAFDDFKTTQLDTGLTSSADMFGTRAFLKDRYINRMAAAVIGIYGNSKEEAIYPTYFVDSTGQKFNGTKLYTLHFAADQLPPVNAFWSLTMYQLPASLLYANPLNRYLINSPMLPNLKRDQDGGLTVYVQHNSPGADKESNWLPAPAGPFFTALRLYWPKPAALKGAWKAPALQNVGDATPPPAAKKK